MFSGGGHPYESKQFLFVYITQCVPTEGCKITIPEGVVNLSSLIFIPVEFNLSMPMISFFYIRSCFIFESIFFNKFFE